MRWNHAASAALAALMLSALLTACSEPEKETKPTLRLPELMDSVAVSGESEEAPASTAEDTQPTQFAVTSEETRQSEPEIQAPTSAAPSLPDETKSLKPTSAATKEPQSATGNKPAGTASANQDDDSMENLKKNYPESMENLR